MRHRAAFWGGERGGPPPAWDAAGLEGGRTPLQAEVGPQTTEPGRTRLDSTLASDSEGRVRLPSVVTYRAVSTYLDPRVDLAMPALVGVVPLVSHSSDGII